MKDNDVVKQYLEECIEIGDGRNVEFKTPMYGEQQEFMPDFKIIHGKEAFMGLLLQGSTKEKD